MQLITGNLWDELGKADLLFFTANCVVNSREELVMGAGVAAQAKKRFPLAPSAFGRRLASCGRFYGVVTIKAHHEGFDFRLGALQTKYHFKDPSPLELVKRSVEKLALGASQFERIAMPIPGVGLGGLKESDVMPILKMLPDYVFVYKLP